MQEFPRWYYGPGGASAIFNSEDDVPEGWKTHPSEVVEDDPDDGVAHARAEALAALRDAGVSIGDAATDEELAAALDALDTEEESRTPEPRKSGRPKKLTPR